MTSDLFIPTRRVSISPGEYSEISLADGNIDVSKLTKSAANALKRLLSWASDRR